MKARAEFDVTGWNPVSADEPDAGPALSRVVIEKTFRGGDIDGKSSGEGLFCGMGSPEAGAGYVVSERLTGAINGRSGTLVLHHGGLMGPGMAPRTFGDIVPGSGTGELVGITGTIEIQRDGDGTHVMILDYEFREQVG